MAAAFDEVDATAQGRFQGFGEVEELIEGRQVAFGFEFDQEICVACLWIRSRCRARPSRRLRGAPRRIGGKVQSAWPSCQRWRCAWQILSDCFRLADHGGGYV